jgi:hypothetical protein
MPGMLPPEPSLADLFGEPDPNFIPALAFCKADILDDPRVRKQPGVPVYEVDVEGRTYRVVWVPRGQYGDGRPGWAVFNPDGYWLGEKERHDSDPVHAQAIYPSAVQAMNMVLLP